MQYYFRYNFQINTVRPFWKFRLYRNIKNRLETITNPRDTYFGLLGLGHHEFNLLKLTRDNEEPIHKSFWKNSVLKMLIVRTKANTTSDDRMNNDK